MNGEMVSRFFAFARERHSIYLKRQDNHSWPWTDDPILQQYKFTNVFREFDRTTEWFRQNVRDILRNQPEALLATVLFRWFNRTETGEVIFNQPNLFSNETPWETFLRTGETTVMRHALRSAFPRGPYVTGAYMIRSPTGMEKLDGLLQTCRQFYWDSKWHAKANKMLMLRDTDPMSIETFTRWLQAFPNMGPFLAYEVACDLHYTALLDRAPDIMTWANLGPGAKRGVNRINVSRNLTPRKPKDVWGGRRMPAEGYLRVMRDLLEISQDPGYWPTHWRAWDMRTVEHTLCEFDKYCRASGGEGKPKQLYRRTALTPRLLHGKPAVA